MFDFPNKICKMKISNLFPGEKQFLNRSKVLHKVVEIGLGGEVAEVGDPYGGDVVAAHARRLPSRPASSSALAQVGSYVFVTCRRFCFYKVIENLNFLYLVSI